jgi:hypothetical protein
MLSTELLHETKAMQSSTCRSENALHEQRYSLASSASEGINHSFAQDKPVSRKLVDFDVNTV